MIVRDAHQNRFPSREMGSDHGVLVGTVELTREEVYEALAAAAVAKRWGGGREGRGVGSMDPALYSVSVFPDALASFVVLGGGIRAELWDGYSEVVLTLLPRELA